MKVGDLVKWGQDEDEMFGVVIDVADYKVDFDVNPELSEFEKPWIFAMGKKISVMFPEENFKTLPEECLDIIISEDG